MTVPGSLDHATVVAALQQVRDPELDESVVALDFVGGIEIDGNDVAVALRLPTYFCAANFAWLMVSDAREALAALPGVGGVEVTLPDHYASDEITGGVNGHDGFDDAFAGEGDGGGLEELRLTFRRKAFLSRQYRLLRALMATGRSPVDLVDLTIADVNLDIAPGPERDTYLQRRGELGLDVADEAVLVVDEHGAPVSVHHIEDHLIWIRTVSVSIEGNAGACRGLLAARYGTELPPEDAGHPGLLATMPSPVSVGPRRGEPRRSQPRIRHGLTAEAGQQDRRHDREESVA